MKKIGITIGISALNEERNIAFLLRSLLRQKDGNFVLERILVVSDGSTDGTVKRARSIHDERISVIDGGERQGKTSRINQIFEVATSEIVAILDADIAFADSKALQYLIDPLIANPSVALVSGHGIPAATKTLFQKVVAHGFAMWQEVLTYAPRNSLYHCEGSIRAFRRSLYTQFRFPQVISDEPYPFLYCAKHNIPFRFASSAITVFKLPATYSDYVKQMTRYLKSQPSQEAHFDSEFVAQHYIVTTRQKFLVLMKNIITTPFLTMAYVIVLVTPKLQAFLHQSKHTSGVWDQVVSTK